MTQTIWAMSNRQDDRVVLWEQDEAHPGGEAFIGGSAPDLIAKTPRVEGLLREGLLIEIPEPPDSRKKPIVLETESPSSIAPNQPGQRTQLGRVLDPELVPESAQAKVEAAQKQAGDSKPVPSAVIVPPKAEPERSTRGR